MIVIFFEFAPTTIHEKKFAYVESSILYMLVHHENNALGAGNVEDIAYRYRLGQLGIRD